MPCLAALPFALLVSAGTAAISAGTVPPPRVRAVLVNGGRGASTNYLSHLHHLQDMVGELLRRGVDADDIHVFSSDGEDPAPDLAVRGGGDPRSWLLEGTDAGRRLNAVGQTDTTWSGMRLRPARLGELRSWFASTGSRLTAGDLLLVFVTDHGDRDGDDPEDGHIALWGEKLSVGDFREILRSIPPGVRVVSIMSQCHSGCFAAATGPGSGASMPEDACGFYSTTADRKAYGCFPEGRDRDRMGHAFRFTDAMQRQASLTEAHEEVLVTDSTPDVPIRTSDVHVERILRGEADRRGYTFEDTVDQLLLRAWDGREAPEPEAALLDRIAVAYGVARPRALAELEAQSEHLGTLARQLDTYGQSWDRAFEDLCRQGLRRFEQAHAGWTERLRADALAALDEDGRRALRGELLDALEPFSRAGASTWRRLSALRERKVAAEAAEYRVELRQAVLLRMRTLLLRVAARRLLAAQAPEHAADRATLDRLEACERSVIGRTDGALAGHVVAAPDPLPPLAQDLAVVEKVLPSWLGIRYAALPESRRAELGVSAGAVLVEHVFDDSAASRASLRPGDVVTGPPDDPFEEPNRIREWIMTSPRGTPLVLRILREREPIDVSLTLDVMPADRPRVPAIAPAGSTAPGLRGLHVLVGPDELVPRGWPHVLFFWEVACDPCTRALPDLLAWSDATGVPVIAVTDDAASSVMAFLRRRTGPFPDLVALDAHGELRFAYGVSRHPTFVLVDADGCIAWRQAGYAADTGLDLPQPWTVAPPPAD
jgi:hypothetical protein